MRTGNLAILLLVAAAGLLSGEERPRARDLGIQAGVLPPGSLNAITEVAGVRLGDTMPIRGDSARTGVAAILPQGGNLSQEKAPGAAFVDRLSVLRNIARQIEALKAQFPQLADFSAGSSLRPETTSLSYGFHTHKYSGRGGGWTSQVPNPDADGVWFYIDIHDPRSTAQIDTQPVTAALCLDGDRVQFLILQGSATRPLGGAIQNILRNNGVRACESR